jgi:lysozyme family protein
MILSLTLPIEVVELKKDHLMNFKDSLTVLLKHEGGYVNNPKDPGGETNYGITKNTAAAYGYTSDMKDIPMSKVEEIYLKGYWNAINADILPDEVRHHVFDAAVNSGPVRAVKWLQEALGTKPDGVFGNDTYSKATQASGPALAAKFNGIRLRYLTDLPTFDTFGRGWTRRVASYLENV